MVELFLDVGVELSTEELPLDFTADLSEEELVGAVADDHEELLDVRFAVPFDEELDVDSTFSVDFLSPLLLDFVLCASTVNAMNTRAKIMIVFFMTSFFL
ncbi:MAG: hypothetical protein K9H64_04055 [Bacteroidales bacterium]|nr:hypothetical protein [Bacteroidales bacterium]MCF8455059.1 hypothetical protein [Bacteroidales bacterium]